VATEVIAAGAVKEEDTQKDEVREGEERASRSGGKGPTQRQHQLGYVMKMTSDTPPPTSQQLVLPLFSVFRLVLGVHVLRRLPPDLAVPVCLPEMLSLTVSSIIDDNIKNSKKI